MRPFLAASPSFCTSFAASVLCFFTCYIIIIIIIIIIVIIISSSSSSRSSSSSSSSIFRACRLRAQPVREVTEGAEE